MAAIKQLAGQTMWYGISSVGAKFLNYLLVPILTYFMSDAKGQAEYGIYSLLYSYLGVLNIVFTYGMETGYFKFSSETGADKDKIFQTAFGSLLITTFTFCSIIFLLRVPIESLIDLGGRVELIFPIVCMLFFDTLSAIPFAKLRKEGRPKKYAFIRVISICINLILVISLIKFLSQLANNGTAWASYIITHFSRVELLLYSNVIASAFALFLLFNEWKNFTLKIDIEVWKRMLKYSAPMVLIGMAGMVNEVMDRILLNKWYPGTKEEKDIIIGVYSAVYKISIVITMFRQAFQMAAEPFFFSQSKEKNSKETYALVFKWFSIILAIAFLTTALFLDFWKYFVHPNYWFGMSIVPILLLANICSGLYYNISIWYKLTDKMIYGILITVFGAVITLIGNYLFIPTYGIMASAWTTFICYFVMLIINYLVGQKFFPVAYPIKRVGMYLGWMLILFFTQQFVVYQLNINEITENVLIYKFITGTILMCVFLFTIFKVEKIQLNKIPYIKKFIK